MALMTGEQYIASIRKRKMQVYMFGEKIENPVDDPILRPSLNSVRIMISRQGNLGHKKNWQRL